MRLFANQTVSQDIKQTRWLIYSLQIRSQLNQYVHFGFTSPLKVHYVYEILPPEP